MKTKKGQSYSELLAVKIEQGTLYTGLRVPMDLGDIAQDYISAMIPLVNERIVTEKKPGATFEKCLERIALHREQLADAYVQLFQTYQRMIEPNKTRRSSADLAWYEMLEDMDDKMLRSYADKKGIDGQDYILPDERGKLEEAIVAAMKGK